MRTLSLALLLLAAGCSDTDKARQVLQNQGYTNINMTGWTPFVCGREDTYKDGFEATTMAGVRVKGAVCCGMFFKGCTVRFD